MPFSSPYHRLDIPKTDVLTYLFGNEQIISTQPIWIDAKDPQRSLSPKQLLSWVRRLGYGLQRLGLVKGDVIMICTPNHIYVPVAFLGIVGSGCIFSGASPTFTPQSYVCLIPIIELTHQLSNIGAKLVLAHPKVLDSILEAAANVGLPRDRVFQFSSEQNPIRHGITDWTTLIASPWQADTWQWPILSPQEATTTIATINFSSGTTGLPKGVCVSHASLIANVEQVMFSAAYELPASKNDLPERWVCFLPLYHAYGQLYACAMAAKTLTPTYIMEKFHYEEFLSVIEKHSITHLQLVPPVLIMLSKRPETARYNLSSLRHIQSGAAPLSRELQNLCRDMFNVRMSQAYGMTELTCGAIILPEGLSDMDASGTVGRLLPNCECKLIGDDGVEVSLDTPGELYIRGPNVCLGYWRNEKATRETLDDEGWVRTGDVAVCNEDGYFWIVDRKKELIKVNGLQVSPAELEATLLENEHVADAAVVQITLGENEWPRAYVVIQPDSKGLVKPQDIQDWIAKRVSKHKWLVGGVTFIDEVPKLASGKIMRKEMREWAKRDAMEMEKNGTLLAVCARL